LRTLVAGAQHGDDAAFDQLVRRFQDSAVAYAFSVLGDFQQAEDAVQEAFIEAFHCLAILREPFAFPGWLRRIVFKQCNRITRKKQGEPVSLEAVQEEPRHHRRRTKRRNSLRSPVKTPQLVQCRLC
jgi:RNA polymerase sigma factor (sigma-70 family)